MPSADDFLSRIGLPNATARIAVAGVSLVILVALVFLDRADAALTAARDAVISGADVLFVASMDNPQDGKHQRISVIDVSRLSASAGASSPCAVVQTLAVDPARFSGPHLLGVSRHREYCNELISRIL